MLMPDISGSRGHFNNSPFYVIPSSTRQNFLLFIVNYLDQTNTVSIDRILSISWNVAPFLNNNECHDNVFLVQSFRIFERFPDIIDVSNPRLVSTYYYSNNDIEIVQTSNTSAAFQTSSNSLVGFLIDFFRLMSIVP